MKKEMIVKLHADFEDLLHVEPDSGVEYWTARDLQGVLGYDRWGICLRMSLRPCRNDVAAQKRSTRKLLDDRFDFRFGRTDAFLECTEDLKVIARACFCHAPRRFGEDPVIFPLRMP